MGSLSPLCTISFLRAKRTLPPQSLLVIFSDDRIPRKGQSEGIGCRTGLTQSNHHGQCVLQENVELLCFPEDRPLIPEEESEKDRHEHEDSESHAVFKMFIETQKHGNASNRKLIGSLRGA